MNEYELIKSLVGNFKRCPSQLNELFEADAEIVRIGDTTIAITIDAMVDEIDLGIYTDPYEIGYISVMASVADLVASGAKLIGVLVSVEWPKFQDKKRKLLFQGIENACKENKMFLLGGDTNSSEQPRVGVVGLGSFQDRKHVKRSGANVGDALFISGKMGGGNANALNNIIIKDKKQNSILPRNLCKLSSVNSSYSSTCTDTSDGFFTSLYNLGMVNKMDFEIKLPISELIDDSSQEIINKVNLPDWFLLAGPVGEYELVFTVPQDQKNIFIQAAALEGYQVLECGKVTSSKSKGVAITLEDKKISLSEVIDAQQKAHTNFEELIENLSRYDIF